MLLVLQDIIDMRETANFGYTLDLQVHCISSYQIKEVAAIIQHNRLRVGNHEALFQILTAPNQLS